MTEQIVLQEPVLNTVHSVTATATPEVYVVRCNLTDTHGKTYDADFVSNPADPYGLGPTMRQWIVDNPDFPITPYVPPPLPKIREGAILLRSELRNNLLAQGVTTAKIRAYLDSIADPITQDQRLIVWEENGAFTRADAFVVELAAHTGLTEEQMDAVFGIGA